LIMKAFSLYNSLNRFTKPIYKIDNVDDSCQKW
jgi:hypothetical protein